MPQAAVAVATWAASAALTIVGTTATGYAVAGAVSSAVLALGGAAGLGAAVGAWSLVATVGGALAGPPKIGAGDSGGSQIDFKADPNAGIPMVLGRTGTGGVIVHANTSGEANKNSHLAFCTVLSAGPVQSIESLSANDELVTFADELATNTKFAGAMWTRHQLGAKPSGPFPYPGVPDGWIPEWTDDHKVSGLAASWFVLHYDQEIYAGGAPKPTWVVNGVAVYDPRLDSTYPGGSGACRSDDETTWTFEGADNPFLQGLTFCIGRRANGVLTHGLGAPLEMIDVAAFVEGANVCEANGWITGGVVSSADSKWEALKAMLQAGGGAPMKLGARISCIVNAPRVSLNASDPWTGADLLGEAQITATQSRRARINTIVPRYRSEAHQWQVVANAPVVATTYVTEDGGERRSREVEYSLVQDPAQAAQLAAYDIVNSREIGPIVLPSKPRYVGYKPGDCITVDEPEIGLENRKVLILGRTIDPDSGMVTSVCQTETDAKHDFALGRTDVAPPTPGFDGADPSYVGAPDLGSWVAVGGVLEGPDGAMPAIIVTGEIDNPTISGVIADHRLVLDLGAGQYGDWVSTEHPASVRRIELRGLLPRTPYHVRIRYRSARGVEGDLGLDLGIVTTGDLISSGVREIGGYTPGELVAYFEGVSAQGSALTAGLAEAYLRLDEERGQMLTETFHQGRRVKRILIDEDEMWEEGDRSLWTRTKAIAVQGEDGQSMILQKDTLIWDEGEGSTVAAHLDAVVSQIGDDLAAAIAETRTWVDSESAGAQFLQQLEVAFGGTWSGAITILAQVSSDFGAAYTLALDVNGKVAGTLSQNDGTISSILFLFDEVGFTDGTTDVYPFSIVGGVVRATDFEVDRVTAGSIVTDSLVGGAVSSLSAHSESSSTGIAGSPVSVLTHNHTSTGAQHTVSVACTVAQTGGGESGVIAVLYCNGIEVDRGSSSFQGPFSHTIPIIGLHTPGSGTASYHVTCSQTGGSTGSNQHVKTTIVVTELKK